MPDTNFIVSCLTDPLVHHGRHFGRTVHALCNFQALLTNGVLHLQELAERSPESFTVECVPFNYANSLHK